MELNDPSIITMVKREDSANSSESQPGTTVSNSAQQSAISSTPSQREGSRDEKVASAIEEFKKNPEIDKIIEQIIRRPKFHSQGYHSHSNKEKDGFSHSRNSSKEHLDTYLDYKPSNSSKKVYSIKDMMEVSQNVPDVILEKMVLILPKRKFWRLLQRHQDPKAQKAVSNATKSLKDGTSNERRNARNKTSKQAKKLRNASKSNSIDDKDKESTEKLMALEESIELSGHTLQDFEAWKVQMRELENRKNGMTITEPNANSNNHLSSASQLDANNAADKPRTSSSISEFLNMKSKLQAKEMHSKDDKNSYDTISKEPKESPSNLRNSSSRFSLFFNSNTVQNNTEIKVPDRSNEMNHDKGLENQPASSGASRLMSFFQQDNKHSNTGINDSNSPKKNEMLNTVSSSGKMEESGIHSKPSNVRDSEVETIKNTMNNAPPGLQTSPGSHPPQQHQHNIAPMMHPPPPMPSNNFFQDLLNKNKANDQFSGTNIHMPPPMNASFRKGFENQSQNPMMNMPANMQHSQFSMAMPPNMMPPPPLMRGFPPPVPPGFIPIEENKNKTSLQGSPDQNDVRSKINPSLPYGIPNQQPYTMPPPGFGAIPLNYSPNIALGSNGGVLPPGMVAPPMPIGTNPGTGINHPVGYPFVNNETRDSTDSTKKL